MTPNDATPDNAVQADLPSDLIDRFLMGQADEAEQIHLRQVLAPDLIALADALHAKRQLPLVPDDDVHPIIADARNRIGHRLEGYPLPEAAPAVRPVQNLHELSVGSLRREGRGVGLDRRRTNPWVRRALALGALSAVAIVVVARYTRQSGSAMYRTAIGERTAVTLRDGSRVILAPNTTLTVANNFGTATRTLSLSGEALCDVARASGAPFIVRVGTISARVLGTRFTVQHYPAQPTVQIAVASGRVVAATQGRTVTLAQGAVAQLTDSTAVTAIVKDLSPYMTWTQGQLVFERAPVRAMLATLEQWYGYHFNLADSSLAEQRVSTTFALADSTYLFPQITSLLDVSIIVRGNLVTLTPRRARHAAPRLNVLHLLPEMGR